jgi:ATP-dependent Clp protease ATP-binding subunit ClpX
VDRVIITRDTVLNNAPAEMVLHKTHQVKSA